MHYLKEEYLIQMFYNFLQTKLYKVNYLKQQYHHDHHRAIQRVPYGHQGVWGWCKRDSRRGLFGHYIDREHTVVPVLKR